MKDNDWSFEYKQAIALLAQKIYESGELIHINSNDLDWAWLWDSVVAKRPGLCIIAQATEVQLDYELSFNQCCNAVSWVYKYNPSVWQPLLEKAMGILIS